MYTANVQKITQYFDELSKLAPQFLKDHYGAKDNVFHKKEAEFAEYQNEEPFVIRNWRYLLYPFFMLKPWQAILHYHENYR